MDVPPLRVSRPVSACARCRSAKIKCDGKLPACSACEKVGKAKDCSSANDQFAKGKERSYVASLESRIERLQRQISDRQKEREAHSVNFLAAPGTGSVRQNQSKDALDVDDLVSDFGYLSVNATASGYHGFTREMSFARLVLSTASVTELPPALSGTLPPKEVAVALIKETMEKVFNVYPILPSATIFGSVEAVYQHHGRFCPPKDNWNFRLTLAIAYLLRSRVKEDASYQDAMSHASMALEHREFVLQPGSLNTIQSLLLLVIFSTLDPTHFDCWYLIGVAARVMVDIGLHQETPLGFDFQTKASVLESRRRIFYCVYALDRIISITYHRYFSISDDSVDVSLPGLTDRFGELGLALTTRNVSVNPLLETIKFRQVQSTVYHNVFSSSRSALSAQWRTKTHEIRKVDDWLSGLPDSTPEPLRQHLHAEKYYICILLLQPPRGNSILDPYGVALLFDYCVGFTRCAWPLYTGLDDHKYISDLDGRRVGHVAQTALGIVKDHSSSLFVALNHQNLHNLPTEHLPPLQRSSPVEKTDQAIECIERIGEVWEILTAKFGKSKAQRSFKEQSKVILPRLKDSSLLMNNTSVDV